MLNIAIPLILSTASWSMQHFVDRMFLSWYSAEAIAAAMPAGMLYFSIVSIFMGTDGCASIFVAQYYGTKGYKHIGPAIKGAGDTRFVMFMTTSMSLFVLIIPTFLVVVVFGYGLMISWGIATAYVILIGFASFFRFLNGKWKTMRVIETLMQPKLTPTTKIGLNFRDCRFFMVSFSHNLKRLPIWITK